MNSFLLTFEETTFTNDEDQINSYGQNLSVAQVVSQNKWINQNPINPLFSLLWKQMMKSY